MRLTIIKQHDTSRCYFDEDTRLYPGSSYDVEVHARELRDLDSAATLLITVPVSGSGTRVTAVTCQLAKDELRRDVRTGTFTFPSSVYDVASATSDRVIATVWVTLGTSVLISSDVLMSRPIASAQASSSPTSASSWRIVDLGTVSSLDQLSVEDHTQVRLVTSATGPVYVRPTVYGVEASGIPFDAYVTFVRNGKWSPLTSVFIGGSAVDPDYEDSWSLESTEWVLHVFTIAGSWHCTLKASGVTVGSQNDPDGELVPGMEVNQ